MLFLTEQFLDENQVVVKQPEMPFREFPVEVNGATSGSNILFSDFRIVDLLPQPFYQSII